MTRTYEQLKNALTKKGYSFFENNLSLNFIWERTSDDFTNKFTDFLHIAYKEDGVNKVFTIPATTKPGLKGSVLNPTTVEGITGTACIQPGQYKSAWQFRDTTKEFSSYPYFRQVAAINYWRDGDKDTKLDRINEQKGKIFGTHWHKMSNIGTFGSGEVNNWSLGCMGAAEPEFKKILPIVRKSVKLYGDKFTGTIIESKDII